MAFFINTFRNFKFKKCLKINDFKSSLIFKNINYIYKIFFFKLLDNEYFGKYLFNLMKND